jgi:hypothetical protein
MKHMAWLVVLSLGAMARAEVTPDEVIKAVDQMTPEQVNTLGRKLEARYWKPIPEGFFSRVAIGIDASGYALDKVDLAGATPSAGARDLEDAGGMDVSFLWQAWTPRSRIGFRCGSFGSEDDDLTPGGYSRAELYGGYGALVGNWQFVRADHWLLWGEVAGGYGQLSAETVDTPAGGATTQRDFDGDFWLGDVRLGVSWRFNPVLDLHASAGYRFAQEVDLEEGGDNAGFRADPSGFGVQLGLGINF